KGLTPQQLERPRQMIRDLNRALMQRAEGGDLDFEAFQRQYPELAGNAKDWDDLLKQLAMGMAAMRSLWNSMSGEMREQLEELLGAAFDDPALQSAMNELAHTLGQLMPLEGYEHDLTGDDPLPLAEARGLRAQMNPPSRDEIFSTLKRDAFGKHRADARGRGGDPTDELKTYEFGDPFLLDLPGTVRNAVFRGGAGTPVKLHPADFDVYRTELVTQSA